MFNKSPDNLFNAVFNLPQGLTMTIAMSLFTGTMEFVSVCRTFVCAFCAGVMLALFLRVPAFGEWTARSLGCDRRPLAHYLVSGFASGALMGIPMNLFLTFMGSGPVPGVIGAYFHTLPFAMLVSGLATCVWTEPANRIVALAYPPADRTV